MSSVGDRPRDLITRRDEPAECSFYLCWDRSYQICEKVFAAVGDCFGWIWQTVYQRVDIRNE